MGIVFRQSIKSTIIAFIGAAMGGLFIWLRIGALDPQQQGLSADIINKGSLMTLFLGLGMAPTLLTFIHRYEEKQDDRKGVLLTLSMLLPAIGSLIFTLFYFILQPHVISRYQLIDRPFISSHYMWLPVLGLLWTMQMILEQYLVSQHKVAMASFMKEIVLRAGNILLLVCCWLGWISFSTFFIGTVLIFIVPIIGMYLVATGSTKHFAFSFNWSAFSRKEYKELLHFAWYHFLSTASQASLGFLDAILVVPLAHSGASALAVYTPAVFLSTIAVIPYRAMISASFPVLNRAYIDNDMSRIKQLFRRSGINIWIVGLLMSLLIVCNLNNVLAVLPEGKGMEALPKLVFILLIGKLIDMGTGLNNELLSISRYYKFSFYASLVLLISMLFLERWWIPLYGNIGAAWGATISLGIFNLLKMVFLWRKFGLHPFDKPMLLAFFAALVTFFAVWFLPQMGHFIIDTAIRSVLIVGIYGGLLIFLKPSPDLNHYLSQIKENKRLF